MNTFSKRVPTITVRILCQRLVFKEREIESMSFPKASSVSRLVTFQLFILYFFLKHFLSYEKERHSVAVVSTVTSQKGPCCVDLACFPRVSMCFFPASSGFIPKDLRLQIMDRGVLGKISWTWTNVRTLWLKSRLLFCPPAVTSAGVSILRQQCIWLPATHNRPPQPLLLQHISFLRPRWCCLVFYRTHTYELTYTMVTVHFLIISWVHFIQISQFRATGLHRNVPPAEKPDTATVTPPLHLRAGADQGSEKTISFFIFIFKKG